MATRAQLVDAARDLNKVLDLSPQIDVKQGVEDLKSKITEAASLLREGDAIDPATREVIDSINAPAQDAETSGTADVAEKAPKPAKVKAEKPPKEPKPAKVKAEKPPKAPKALKAPKEPSDRTRYADTAPIKLKVTENPKQKGSASHARFELYRDGMTCGEFIAAGGSRADLSWDTKKGFIEVTQLAEQLA